jgi:RNA methyltransferase, TrmH family
LKEQMMMNDSENKRSPSRRQWREWCKLGRRKERERTGLFVAEGERTVGQILENGLVDVVAVVISESFEWSVGSIESYEDRCYQVDGGEFMRLVDTATPQGIAAICRIPDSATPEELGKRSGIILATDAVQDPGNLGTMIRTAVWYGVSGLVCGKGTVDPYHPKVVRSTAGATGALPVCSGDLGDILDRMERLGWNVRCLDSGENSRSIRSLPKSGQQVLVVGNEANGIDPSLKRSGRLIVHIGSAGEGHVESLNAAVATGIALHELNQTRQQE